MNVYTFHDRKFQIWAATSSLARLVLRSPKDGKNAANLDVCFTGVKYLGVPWYMDGLSIEKFENSNFPDNQAAIYARKYSSCLFGLTISGEVFYVVAGKITVDYNELDTSAVPFSMPHTDGNY
jgi:hypothetical protein